MELTVSKRSGMYKYQFPSSENQVVILDLVHRDEVLDAKINPISNTELNGYCHSKAWATNQRLFFSLKTSHAFTDMLQSPPKEGMLGVQRIVLEFDNPNNAPNTIKMCSTQKHNLCVVVSEIRGLRLLIFTKSTLITPKPTPRNTAIMSHKMFLDL